MYSKCQKCGKKLTDPESIKRGYGPECWNSLTAHYYRNPVDWENYSVPGQMNIEDFLDMEGGDNGNKQYQERIGKQKYVLTVEQSRHLTP